MHVKKLLGGTKVARSCFNVSQLQFVEDLLIFTEAEKSQAKEIKRCLLKYQAYVNSRKFLFMVSKNVEGRVSTYNALVYIQKIKQQI